MQFHKCACVASNVLVAGKLFQLPEQNKERKNRKQSSEFPDLVSFRNFLALVSRRNPDLIAQEIIERNLLERNLFLSLCLRFCLPRSFLHPRWKKNRLSLIFSHFSLRKATSSIKLHQFSCIIALMFGGNKKIGKIPPRNFSSFILKATRKSFIIHPCNGKIYFFFVRLKIKNPKEKLFFNWFNFSFCRFTRTNGNAHLKGL